jgi:histidinol-phosphate aminotransferase
MPVEENPACRSRRTFLQVSAAAAAVAVGYRIVTEPMLAHASSVPYPKDAVLINANENPLGPCGIACDAVNNVASQGGRYSDWMTTDLIKTFAATEGLKPEYVRAFPGSSGPLH